MADNAVLKVSGESLDRLKVVMGLTGNREAKGFATDDEKGIVFFWADHEKMTPFPTPLGMDRCAEIASDWLEKATYGKQPDHDGDNEKGWLCYRDGWGHIDTFGWQAFIAVKPLWMMYGK